MSKLLRQALEIGSYFSCLMLALSAFYICIEVQMHGVVPSSFNLILTVCFTVLLLAMLFSIKAKWKTFAVLFTITFLFFLILISSVGLNIVINNIFEERTTYTLIQGLMVLSVGGVLSWVTFRLLKSKALN